MIPPVDSRPSDLAFAVQRSEEARACMVIGVLAAVLLLTLARRAAGGVVMTSPVFGWTVGLLGFGMVFEGVVLRAVALANGEQRRVGERVWRLGAGVEFALAVGPLVILHLLSPQGEVAALSAPALLILPILVLLSVLRLRPAVPVWTGLAAAAAHAVLAVRAFVVRAGEPGELPVYLSYAVLLALTGAAGGLVAGRVRGYVEAAVRAEAERRRAQVFARDTLIFGLAKLAEYRDSDTGAHLERISVYCGLLARELAREHPFIDEEWARTLSVASSMHDIGKVGIPDTVLCKPGRLTGEERAVIERHPELGHRVLAAILDRGDGNALLRMSDEIAACHHERWDGTGYPGRLAGEAIPLSARIVAVADVYDALTSARVYKPAMAHQEACGQIARGSGTQFDPRVVAAFSAVSAAFDTARREMADAAAVGAAAAQ